MLVTGSAFSDEQGQIAARLVRLSQGGQVVSSTDLLAHELTARISRCSSTSRGELDALTNPYDVLALPARTPIADAGANVINEVAANGRVSRLTVLPVATDGQCAESPNSTVNGFGCDPVPSASRSAPTGSCTSPASAARSRATSGRSTHARAPS